MPSLDADILRHVSTLLRTSPKTPSCTSFLQAVDERLGALSNIQDVIMATSTSTPTAWRVLVRDAVQAIVNPHVLDWMEDGDALGETDIIRRALQEIDERFERE